MLPLAPGRLSTMKRWPRRSDSHWTHQARVGVGTPAGAKADDDAYRPRRIGLCLCPRSAGYGRQCSSTRGQPRECAAVKFHDASFTVCATTRISTQPDALQEQTTSVL